MKRLVALVAVVLVLETLIALFNATRLTSRQPAARAPIDMTFDLGAAAGRLSEAVRFQTVTTDEKAISAPEAFTGFHAFLERAFPRVAKNLPRETVGSYSLLYTWTGTHPERPPVILTAHQDVVPADPASLAQWHHPPFDGAIADGAVWGRGTLDDKGALLALLEATETLLARGFTPDRTIYFAFGHDEEGGGARNGAAQLADALKARGVHDAVLLDEGGWIVDIVPGVKERVALIGVAEKGFVSVELTMTSEGGHSSMPPSETVIGALARAVDRVERSPMPARLDGAAAALFDTLAPEMSFGYRVLFGNRWLTGPLVVSQLAKKHTTNAIIRTTTAPTIFQAGDKDNVLASTGRAVINFRLLPGDTADAVLAHVRQVVNDPRIDAHFYRGSRGFPPTDVSPTTIPEFAALGGAVRSVQPEVLIAPYLTVGATDARQYSDITSARYRFVPINQPGGNDLLHAPDEHIIMNVYGDTIRMYGAIITALTGPGSRVPGAGFRP